MAELTTTSYAILALLGVQPWTTYQLAQQMKRSVNDVWPRAESVVYEEPKRLVASGHAIATVDHVGRRRSTTYAITAKGRRALRKWLAIPGAAPALEFEALLKVAFGDLGDLDGLQRNLAAIADMADARASYIADRIREYQDTGGPFPDRLPVITLVARFHEEQAAALQRWARWAAREVDGWTGVTPSTGAVEPAR
jgi:PadR family transcriptional regulator, regulatory protein AphA